MSKKNKIIFAFILILVIFIFVINKIIRVNINFPQKGIIKEVSINENLECEDIDIKIKDKKIEKISSSGFPISAITFEIRNKNSNPVDISNIMNDLLLYSDFSNTPIQNIDYELDRNKNFDIYYSKKDFLLKSNELKEFVFYFYLYKNINDYKNFIYIGKNFYKNEFNDYLKKGTILYKTIDLGEYDE